MVLNRPGKLELNITVYEYTALLREDKEIPKCKVDKDDSVIIINSLTIMGNMKELLKFDQISVSCSESYWTDRRKVMVACINISFMLN